MRTASRRESDSRRTRRAPLNTLAIAAGVLAWMTFAGSAFADDKAGAVTDTDELLVDADKPAVETSAGNETSDETGNQSEDSSVSAQSGLVGSEEESESLNGELATPSGDPEILADEAGEDQSREPASKLAENVDLSQPVDPGTMQSEADSGEAEAADSLEPNIPLTYSDEQPSLFLLDAEVPAATSTRLSWSPDQNFDGIAVPTPVLVVNGAKRGPVLCVTAAVHGDELNGIEVVRRVLYDLDPEKLSGAVIGVPIVKRQ